MAVLRAFKCLHRRHLIYSLPNSLFCGFQDLMWLVTGTQVPGFGPARPVWCQPDHRYLASN